MKKILIDLNIIIDLLNKRDDHVAAASVFDLCERRKVKGYICSHEITTLSYLLGRFKFAEKERNRIINQILDVLSVVSANEKILRDALNSSIKDYEDAVIERSALKEKVDIIITRNIKDFERGEVNCCTAREFINNI